MNIQEQIEALTQELRPYPPEGTVWEVDVFHGVNHGLIVAEVELPSENYPIILPPFIGQDVSNDVRYSNAMLSVVPFKEWNGKPNQVH